MQNVKSQTVQIVSFLIYIYCDPIKPMLSGAKPSPVSYGPSVAHLLHFYPLCGAQLFPDQSLFGLSISLQLPLRTVYSLTILTSSSWCISVHPNLSVDTYLPSTPFVMHLLLLSHYGGPLPLLLFCARTSFQLLQGGRGNVFSMQQGVCARGYICAHTRTWANKARFTHILLLYAFIIVVPVYNYCTRTYYAFV